MTTPATLLKQPEPDPEFVKEHAKQHLIALLNYCESAEGDERLFRYHDVQKRLYDLAAEADITLTSVPKGKARPEPENKVARQ